MIINDILQSQLVRYFSGTSDTSDTSDTSTTANSSDASKTSASVTRLSSYFRICRKPGLRCVTVIWGRVQAVAGSKQRQRGPIKGQDLLSATVQSVLQGRQWVQMWRSHQGDKATTESLIEALEELPGGEGIKAEILKTNINHKICPTE